MRFLRACVALFLALGLAAMPAGAQTEPSPAAVRYTQDELDQLLAPIALYPDQLLTQVLIAATYPLEVVQAARFVQENPGLTGDALDDALAQRNWDPSVQSLAAFPQVLAMMNDKLDWTQRLGDAFLADQERVMNTVQSLRRRAEAAGNLRSTPEQTVISQDDEIVIQPAGPDVIYVPVYDPLVIYGPWWAPAYPPWFWYPPPFYGYPAWPVFGVGIWFGGGRHVSHDHWGWAHADWRRHHVTVNTVDNRFWDRPGRRPPSGSTWQHAPEHRRGVAYPDTVTRARFAPEDPNATRARESYRGRELLSPRGFQGDTGANVPPSGAGRPVAPRASAQTSPARPSGATSAAPSPGIMPPRTPSPPSPGIAAPMQQSRPIASPPATVFDPGVSRQQAQINAQRGLESRHSIVSPPPAAARMPVAPPMSRAPASQGMTRAPAPSPPSGTPSRGGGPTAPPRGR